MVGNDSVQMSAWRQVCPKQFTDGKRTEPEEDYFPEVSTSLRRGKDPREIGALSSGIDWPVVSVASWGA